MGSKQSGDFDSERAEVVRSLLKDNVALQMKQSADEEKASLVFSSLKRQVHSWDNLQLFRDLHKNFRKFEATPLYKALKQMPKGVLQHCHLPATLNVKDYLEVMTHHPDVYIDPNSKEINVNRFEAPIDKSSYIPILEYRKKHGDAKVDEEITNLLLMQDHEIRDTNTKIIFDHFDKRFMKMGSAFFYQPILTEFMRRCVTEMKEDNIQGAEIRNVCFMLVRPDSVTASRPEELKFYKDMKEEFGKGGFPVNWIHTGVKETSKDPASIKRWMEIAELAFKTPEFKDVFAGVDMVDYEGNFMLWDMRKELLELKKRNPGMELILHAGESIEKTNYNMIDAVLLGSKRLGHGTNFALNPNISSFIKKHDVCVEINLISNFMLGVMRDPFWHPLRSMINMGVPCAISSDDCLFWNVAPLTMDFFVAALYCDLELMELKWLIQNSIRYSYFKGEQLAKLNREFEERWAAWVKSLTTTNHESLAPAQRLTK